MMGFVEIGGKYYRVKTIVKRYNDSNEKNKAYSYEVTEIELIEGTPGDDNKNPLPRTTTNSISAAKLLKGVEKSTGNGEKILDNGKNASKIVDENGFDWGKQSDELPPFSIKGDTRFSITQEEQRIKDNAVASGTFMKAPNGNKTNLTEKQWLQARTKSFKDWFGDWEIAQLIRQAQNAWEDSNSKSKFVFSPSERLEEAYKDILGHEIKAIVLTDDAIRHIKKNHGENEELRGQVNITPEDIAIIPYVLNNFDTMKRSQEHDDKMGNRAVEIRKRINGVSVVATIEKGNDKEFVVTNWEFVKSNALDADDTTPGPNVRNDFDAAKIRKEIDAIKDSLKNSSKVLDENGEPRVCYHGTRSGVFTVFDTDGKNKAG